MLLSTLSPLALLAATANADNHNCGGRWGYVANNGFNAWNAQYPVYTDGQKCVCTGPKTCIHVPAHQKCVNTGYGFVQMSLCNDNNYGKCVDVGELRSRFEAIANECFKQTNYHSVSGQKFYGDNTNVIVNSCPSQT